MQNQRISLLLIAGVLSANMGFFAYGEETLSPSTNCFQLPFHPPFNDPNSYQTKLHGKLVRKYEAPEDNRFVFEYSILQLKSPICVEGLAKDTGQPFKYENISEIQLWAGLTDTGEATAQPEVTVNATFYTSEVLGQEEFQPREKYLHTPVFIKSFGIFW